jgi:hypothetical protein
VKERGGRARYILVTRIGEGARGAHINLGFMVDPCRYPSSIGKGGARSVGAGYFMSRSVVSWCIYGTRWVEGVVLLGTRVFLGLCWKGGGMSEP